MEGGAHENERRPGTENTAAIAGLAEAVRRHGVADPAETARQEAWIENFWARLKELGALRRNGHATERLPNTLSVTFYDLHPEELLIALDLAGVAVSSGSACLVGSVQPSHVLAAMGLDAAQGATVRFSIGAGIRDEDLDEIAGRVETIVRHQRGLRMKPLEAAA